MSKIGFKRLSRGVRLLTDHIHAQIQKALTLFTSTGVSTESLQAGKGRMRISFPWSDIRPGVGPGTPNYNGTLRAFFALPPPQEMFRSGRASEPSDVVYVFDSITLGFDQRAEVAAITEAGDLNFDESDKLTFAVSLSDKVPLFVSGSYGAANCLAQFEFDALNFSNVEFQTNPVIVSDLGILIDPYKSLMLEIDLSKLQESSVALALNSLVVTLDFYVELMERDRVTDPLVPWEVQNIPTSHLGARSTSPQTLTVPAAGAVITADSGAHGDGVQTSIEMIDSHFHDGLVGGYGEKSAPNGFSNILTDAAYDVIAVPMWGNGWDCVNPAVGVAPDMGNLPFVGAAPFASPACDRRIIPIQYPMVVHHVLAAAHYGSSITSPTFEVEIGVGLGCGIRSDLFESRQLAHAKWTSANEALYKIDSHWDGVSMSNLYSVPLVWTVGQPGIGYASQHPAIATNGTPIFCGQSLDSEQPRTDMAAGVNSMPGPMPLMHGKEQFLEVRWSFNDPAGLANLNPAEGPIGFGGHWVYIIGKKHLC